MEATIHRGNEMALLLRSRDPLAIATESTSTSPYVHRDLWNLNNVHMSLPDLCETIPEMSLLVKLKIVASECYVAHTAVRHRYLLLELRYGRAPIWVRFDRRRSLVSIPSFLLASFKGPANDTVAMSLKKENLIDQNSTRENRQECFSRYAKTFGEMRHFFALVVRELTHYRLFDANCWLFAGTVQYYLHQQANAKFVFGRLPKSTWASKTRHRVMTAFEKIHNISTAPLVFEDVHKRLEACRRHPLFEDYDERQKFTILERGIATLENELATGQRCSSDAIELSRELCGALSWNNINSGSPFTDSLIGIGLLLAESCHSLSLALPAILATKTQQLRNNGSHHEFQAQWKRLHAILSGRRQNLTFFQQFPEFCQMQHVYFFQNIFRGNVDPETLRNLQSMHLLGIEAEVHILANSPASCVSDLVYELLQYAQYLQWTERHEEACSVLDQVTQVAQSCHCYSECGYQFGRPSQRLSRIHEYYGDSLTKLSHIDKSMEKYKAAADVAIKGDPAMYYYYIWRYGEVLTKAGRIEESYNVLCHYFAHEKSWIQESPTQYTSYHLANAVKDLCNHPHIHDDHNQQLLMLEDIICWLRMEYADHGFDMKVAALERETLWDYANILVVLGRYEASETVFAKLVEMWRAPYEAEWEDDDRPRGVIEWYFSVLDVYAKILDLNGKEEESRTAGKIAESLQLQHSFLADISVSEIGRTEWRVGHDEDDPEYPPYLFSVGWSSGKARPAGTLPVRETI